MIFEAEELVAHRYEIATLIGSGSSGEVYVAFDTILNRKVALKVFKNSDNLSTARIQREAKILSMLSHPNIVSIYDVGIYKNYFYFILEYVEGETLREIISNQLISIDNVVKYLFNILSALEHMHLNGIIHRDLKPSNLIIDSHLNTLKVMDVLIGKPVTDLNNTVVNITMEGYLIGTLAYMSPEQLAKDKITSKSDIYSLGLIVFEMLTGKLPFDSNLRDIVNRSEYDYSKSINEKRPECPETIVSLVLAMLSNSVNKRPSATEALRILFSDKEILEKANSKGIESDIISTKEERKKVDNDKNLKIKNNYENVDEIYITQLKDKPGVKGTGFFESEESRYKEFSNSINFYRSHLNNDYQTLLSQARVTFWLWFSSFVLGIGILIAASIMLFNNQLFSGGITLLSETFIYFIQNAFKVQENHYREQADKKTKHLELGNYWNLITQSIDALPTWEKKEQKLIELIDVFNKIIISNDKNIEI